VNGDVRVVHRLLDETIGQWTCWWLEEERYSVLR